MSDWQAQNAETWRMLDYALAQQHASTVVWITCDSYHHLRTLVQEFKAHFPTRQHFEHRVHEFTEGSFPTYFHKHLPADAFANNPGSAFVHLFGLELHVGIGMERPDSHLFESLNFERETVFRDFPFVTVIWSDTSSQIKVQTLAPDFWDWMTEKYHFEAPPIALEREVAFLQESKATVAPEQRDALFHQIARQLHLLGRTKLPKDRLSILEALADNYQALQEYDKAIYYRTEVLKLEALLQPWSLAFHLNQLGMAYDRTGKLEMALDHYLRSLKTSQEIDDRKGDGMTLNNISQIHQVQGNYDTALRYLERSLKISEEVGDRDCESVTLNNFGLIHHARGDYDTALGYWERSLKIAREIGDRAGEGVTMNNISQIHDARGDHDSALLYLTQSLIIAQEIGDRAGEGMVLNNMASKEFARGDYENAHRYLEQSLKIRQEIGDIAGIAATLHNLGGIAFEREQYAEALPYYKRSYSYFQKIGSPNAQLPKEHLEAIKQKIGEARFQEVIAGMADAES